MSKSLETNSGGEDLETENGRLKKIVADQALEIDGIKFLLEKKF